MIKEEFWRNFCLFAETKILNFSNFVIEYLGKIKTELENTSACLSGAQMGLNHGKNWRSKISWHTPFTIFGKNIPAQNVPAQNIPAQNIAAQNIPAQNIPAQNIPAQNIPAQNTPA